jgi:hypothetical protein
MANRIRHEDLAKRALVGRLHAFQACTPVDAFHKPMSLTNGARLTVSMLPLAGLRDAEDDSVQMIEGVMMLTPGQKRALVELTR